MINGEEIDPIIHNWAIKFDYYVHLHSWHQLHPLPSYHCGLNFERFNRSGDESEQVFMHLSLCLATKLYLSIHSFIQQISFPHLPNARKWTPPGMRHDCSSKIKSSKAGGNINKSENVRVINATTEKVHSAMKANHRVSLTGSCRVRKWSLETGERRETISQVTSGMSVLARGSSM